MREHSCIKFEVYPELIMSESEFGSSPVSSLHIVSHGSVGFESIPVRHLSVVSDLLSEFLFQS